MKRITLTLFILSLLVLPTCTASSGPETAVTSLTISGGDIYQEYSRADLEAMPVSESVFNDVAYLGVSLPTLLQKAGFDPATIRVVKAIASDGYSINYDTSQVLAVDVIVAYARADGELAEDDGTFRMVLPGEEGKLNVRMLVELQIIQ
jgi:hypothetical protein